MLRLNIAPRSLLALIPAFALGLSACSAKRDDHPELQWARAALERNPLVKVIAVDVEHNTIQLRVVATGEAVTVTPGELAAIPISDLVALTQVRSQSEPAEPEIPTVAETPREASEPEVVAVPAPEGPSASVYTVERQDGRVRVSGPGVSIESAAKPDAAIEGTPLRTDEPIICDGKRFLRLDARRLNVPGDAIVLRGGCELHISNSQISADGTAITVLDATVHISNSEFRGEGGSLTASSAARVFVRNSTFTGLSRRDPKASIQDQGGNTWR